MKCGKAITNDVSKYFGMGPECGNHNYINPFGSVEELKSAVSNYKREYLESIEYGVVVNQLKEHALAFLAIGDIAADESTFFQFFEHLGKSASIRQFC